MIIFHFILPEVVWYSYSGFLQVSHRFIGGFSQFLRLIGVCASWPSSELSTAGCCEHHILSLEGCILFTIKQFSKYIACYI